MFKKIISAVKLFLVFTGIILFFSSFVFPQDASLTPLESPVPLQSSFVTGPAIYGGGEGYKGLVPYRKGGVKAPSFLTGLISRLENQNQNINLAPQLATTRADSRDRFLEGEALLSHRAYNAYIKSTIVNKLIPEKGRQWVEARAAEGLIPIPGLMRETGAFAHAGLGRAYGGPVVYIDADLYNIEQDRNVVRQHESDEIAKWEDLRRALGKNWNQMRDWILKYIDTPDPGLRDPYFAGLTSRRIAKKIHDNAAPLKALYEKYADRVKIREDYIASLMTRYGDGPEDSVFYDSASSKDVAILAFGPEGKITAAESWIEENVPELAGKSMVTLSMEGNITEFENFPDAQNANTKGGLGIYFGDKFDGLDKIGGMDVTGIQPGYLRSPRGAPVDYQKLADAGILEEVIFSEDIKVWNWRTDPVLNKLAAAGDTAWLGRIANGNVEFKVKTYRIKRPGAKRYILVSPVWDDLYTQDRIHRFTQETSFGLAVYEFLMKMKMVPDILHLNEGHCVVAAAEIRQDKSFSKTAIVVTDHTPEEAGHEMFYPSPGADINRMKYIIGHGGEKFSSQFLRKRDGVWIVDFSAAAMELADFRNCVSDEHRNVIKDMFERISREQARDSGRDEGSVEGMDVVGVLNGSSDTWVNQELLDMRRAGRIPAEDEIWRIHEKAKREAYEEVFERTGVRLDPAKPTAWVVRRVTEYKSQYPILRFLVHIMCADTDRVFTKEDVKRIWDNEVLLYLGDSEQRKRIYNRHLDNKMEAMLRKLFRYRKTINGLGMQIVLGGPNFEDYWIGEFNRWAAHPDLKGRFVFVPDSDIKLLKMKAIGSDINIVMPSPLREACSTSDSRGGLNAVVNITIKGAGPKEWITDYNVMERDGSGFFIGSYTKRVKGGRAAKVDSFYTNAPVDIFTKCEIASGMFRREDKGDWKRLMRNSYAAATYGEFTGRNGDVVRKKAVTAEEMEKRYATTVYLAAIEKRYGIAQGIGEAARLFSSESVDRVLEEGGRYEIRYNSVTITGCPCAKEILEDLVRLLKMRAEDPDAIKLIGSDESPLISVTRYIKGEVAGRGDVDVREPDFLKDARLIDMFNMAFAAANITLGRPYSEMDDYEKTLIGFIRNKYRSLTGDDKDEYSVLEAIKHLPMMVPLPLNNVEYNKLTLEKLNQSA
jgi:glycogen synthase